MIVDREPKHVQVFVASCSGCGRLSGEIGLPLVHVDAATHAAYALRRLNAIQYGSGVGVPDLFQPIGHDRGWDDWSLFDYVPCSWRAGMGARPEGIRAVEGRLLVSLPADVTLGEYREELQASLRHLRLHEVTSEMAFMEARSDAMLEYVVQPRYTWNATNRTFRGARRVDDLYVLDPAERPWWLFWTVVAARAALIGVEVWEAPS